MTDSQVLIFDVDGTLADTERDGHRVAFNRAFADADLDWNWSVELYGQLLSVTGGKERIRHYLDRFNTDFNRPDDLDGFIAGIHRAKTEHYMALMRERAIPLRLGVERLLNEARTAGWRLAIATTTTPENVTALLKSTLPPGAVDWFEVIGAGDIVSKKKPAPDIYTWVAAELGIAPELAIVFEDSENGVRSALDAGMTRVVVTVGDYTVNQRFDGATVVLTSLGDPAFAAQAISGEGPANGLVDLAYLRSLIPADD